MSSDGRADSSDVDGSRSSGSDTQVLKVANRKSSNMKKAAGKAKGVPSSLKVGAIAELEEADDEDEAQDRVSN